TLLAGCPCSGDSGPSASTPRRVDTLASYHRSHPQAACKGGARTRIDILSLKVLIALWPCFGTGIFPEGAVLKEAEAVGRCCVTPVPKYWWRRPVGMLGL